MVAVKAQTDIPIGTKAKGVNHRGVGYEVKSIPIKDNSLPRYLISTLKPQTPQNLNPNEDDIGFQMEPIGTSLPENHSQRIYS